MKKKILSLIAVAACAISMIGCGSSSNATSGSSSASGSKSSGTSQVAAIKKKGTINWVTNAEFEPFEYKDGNKIIGIDAEIAQAIADDLGVKLNVNDIAFDSCVPAVSTGKDDFCAAGLTDTPDREKNVDFTNSYFNASQAIVVTKDSKISSRSDLNGKTVGVQQGTTGDTYCTNEKGENDIKVKEVKRYNKPMDAVSDLIAGRIDAVVIDNFPAEKLVSKNSGKIKKLDEALSEEKYAIAVPKGSDLKDEINKVLKKLESDGTLDKINSKYIKTE